MRQLKRTISALLCVSLIASNTSSVMALTFDENNANVESTQTIILDEEVQKIEWTTPDSINLGEEFDAMSGVKALDKDGNDITSKVEVSGSVDTSKPGEYKIEYFIQGEAEKKFTRTITVTDQNENDETLENKEPSKSEDRSESEEAEENISESVDKPQIVGHEVIRVYQGDSFDTKFDIKATDESGQDITSKVEVNGSVDTNTLGEYKLKYLVKTDLGEEATFERTVKVIEKNVFNFFINEDKEVNKANKDIEETPNSETVITENGKKVGFSLYLDLNTSKFTVNNQSPEMLDKSKSKEVYATIKVIDKDNKEKLSLELLGEDTGNSAKLNPLKELEYSFGDFIEIKIGNAKDGFNITGEMSGDIDTKNTKTSSDEEDVKREDYSDGVDNIDFLSNVRFKITEKGIETVYNNEPVITGVSDIEVSSFEEFDPLKGVAVLDDHDKDLMEALKVESENLEKDQKQFIYRVTDEWGRSTEATRIVTLKKISSKTSSNPEQTLANNTISVKGIRFGTESAYGDRETRFKVVFNDKSRKINVIDQDGRSMNPKVKGTYFKMVLYDKDGNVKNEVTLNGSDRSNTSKLDDLRYLGWPYQYGDYISLWHHEAPLRISIAGEISQNEGESPIDFTNNLTKPLLETTRFKLTSTGLHHTLNNPPRITFIEGDKGLTVKRGEEVDLYKGVTFEDDFGVADVEITPFDSTIVGEHTVTYTVTDTWGVTTKKDRKITVQSRNKIEDVFIKFKSVDGTPMFSIGFDEIKKEFILKTETLGAQLNPSNKSIELTINVFNRHNVKKRAFKISGTDTVNSSNIQRLNNYKYEEGDYLQITPKNTSIVTIDGQIEGVPSDNNYYEGVNDLDKWINVRFQLGEGKFTYRYNEAPVISGNDKLEIKQGDELNVLSGMKVSDDHDGQDIDLTENNATVTLISGDGIFLGEQVYEIKYTDSWGRSSSVERIVVITPANPVETYKIEIIGENEEPVLSLAYDSIKKKFRVLSYNPEYSFTNSDEENAFKLEFYDYAKHQKQKEIVLKSEDLIDNNFLSKLTDFTIEEGCYMKLWYHDSTKLKINPNNGSDVDIVFEDDDKMENTRFEISNEKITNIYNKAPKILGIDNVSVVYGTIFDKMSEVSVEDEENELKVAVNGEVNTEKLGPQVLTYSVTDSYGRTTTQKRTVTVVPVYTINEVKYHNGEGQEMFSIGINQSATGFTVKLPESMPKVSARSNFEFKVFNVTGEKVYELKINPETPINEELFNEIKGLIIRPGYSFSVNGSDLTKIKVTEELDKDTQVASIEYSNLTEANRDAVDNVRFKLTENIVQVIYNEAPIINIPEGQETITRNQAITIDDYNLLEGLSIKDDKDELTVEKVKIGLPTDKDILTKDVEEAKKLIGQTVQITYQVEDSWGRTSEAVTRELTIKSAMDAIEFDFLYAAQGLIPNKEESVLKIKFDMPNGRLDFTAGMPTFKFNHIQYGAFAILDKSDNVKYATVFGDNKEFEKKDSIFAQASVPTYNIVNNFIGSINSKRDELEAKGEKLIEYGDKIIVKCFQSPFFYIDGKVIDNQEDYSKGASLGAILENSEFEITPAGLKQVYTGPTINENKFSQLTIYNIISGMQSLNFYLDNSDKSNLRFNAEALDNEWLDTLDYTLDTVLKFEIRNANGTVKDTRNFIGRTRPVDIANLYKNMPVEKGGYFTLKWNRPERVKNSKLYHLRDGYGFEKKVDYSGDVTDETYFNDVRFYFTADGIMPVYNSAPTFEGIENTSISLNESFDARLGVTVKDYLDQEISTYDVIGEVNNTRVGENTLTYSARDSWGRVGSYERKVYVKPKIHENHVEVYDKDNEKSFSIDFEPELTDGSKTGSFKVTEYSDKPLDIDRPTEGIFKIWVYNKEFRLKEEVTLLGRDTSTSEKLNDLKEMVYEEGDYIKVWRAPDENAGNASVNGVKITGHVTGDAFDFTDSSKGIDQMNNTMFFIKQAGLEADYNDAPVLHGVQDKVIYYGDDYDLLEGVTVSDKDEHEKLPITVTPNNINANRIGTTQVTYSVADRFGRITSQTVNVTVRSKSYLNKFEIYGNSTSKAEELKLGIAFNTDVNKFVFYNSSGAVSLDDVDLSAIPSDLNIIIYNRFGREKLNIKLIPSDDENQKKEKLNQLKSIQVEVFDMIQIVTSQHSKVKVTGNIISAARKYQNGFDSVEAMKEVRFQVKNEGLTEVRRVPDNQVRFEGLTELKIKRGEEIDLLENVTVIHPNEILNEIKVSDFDNLTEGIQTITYSVTDSWGSEFTAERTIEVLPFNDLEKVRINIADTTGGELIKIKFDAIESRLSYELNNKSSLLLNLRKVLSFAKALPDDTVVLTVSTFNKSMDEMDSISITKGDIVNQSEHLKGIHNIEFVEGGFIGIDIYDFSNREALKITEPVIYPDDSKDYYQDMKHVRYNITEAGLKAEYNEAPQVIAKNEVEHKIAEDVDLTNALTIKDDRDTLKFMKIDFEEYENYKVGNYKVNATVTDRWGLATTVPITIYVLSYLDDNTLALNTETGLPLVTLGFDSKRGKLTLQYLEGDNNIQLLPSELDKPIIKLNIYNEKHVKQGETIEFVGSDTVATIKEKLKSVGFEDYSYNYNYFIGIEVIDSAKTLISIRNVKQNDEELNGVDYVNGVTDIDHFENVRFELNPYGLTAIYNRAPAIINSLGDRTAVKSFNIEDYGLLNGIVIEDDKDKLDAKNIVIRYNGSDDPKFLHLGENTITFTIKDNWGRESELLTFKLNLTSAMDNIAIDFIHANETLIPDLSKKAATLTFDMEQGKILVNNSSEHNLFKFNDHQYGAFAVYDTSGEPVFKGTLGGLGDFEKPNSDLYGAPIYKYVSEFKEALEAISIGYGYKIKIKIYQSPFVYINGPVNNAQEDYSEGAYLSEILNESTFEIKEEGLVQNYTKPEVAEPKSNDIVWLSGVAGGKLFNINVNPQTRKLQVTKFSQEPLDTLYKNDTPLFSINVYDENDVYQYGIDATTRQYADQIVTALNNKEFQLGWYMKIKILPTDRNRMRNMKIYGDIIKPQEKYKDIDFSSEIKDVSFFNESRFYFTAEGLLLDYNEAATFTGLTDVILIEDKNDNTAEKQYVDLREGVEVSDDRAEITSYEIVDDKDNPIPDATKYRPSTIGAHEVFYVTEDNLGRVTREARFVWLQAPSEIIVKDESLLTVREAEPSLQTEDDRLQYLIDLVKVTDEEDDANNNPIQITANNIAGTFDPNTVGSYPIKYTVQDSDGNVSVATFEINVVRTISVSVPINDIPFQVVTNLKKTADNPEPNPFISAIMKVTNNYVTDVQVSLKEFNKQSGTGGLELVEPNHFEDWNSLTEEQTMKYMALGMYNKHNFNNSSYTKDNPLWLQDNMSNIELGTLPKANSLGSSNSAQLSFVARHGRKFIGGTTKAKFNLVLEFK